MLQERKMPIEQKHFITEIFFTCYHWK